MQKLAAGGKATIRLIDDALIRLTYVPNADVSADDAKDILKQSLALVNGQAYVILVDMSPIVRMSSAARACFGSEKDVLAAAMLGSTPMDRVIAASLTRSVHKVQFFDDERAALRWLSSYLPKQPTTS